MNDISYIYVKDFEWFDAVSKTTFGSFPESKSVQRAILKGGAVNIYAGDIMGDGEPTTLLFQSKIGEAEVCKYEFVEITRLNVLELNLSIEQIEQITNWIQSKNEDIRMAPLPQEFQQEINKVHKEYVESMTEIAEAVEELHNVNKGQFDIICELVDYINNQNQAEEDPARFITHGTKGLGANIAEAVRLLTQYASGPKYGEDREQLLIALSAIINELERRDIHQLD